MPQRPPPGPSGIGSCSLTPPALVMLTLVITGSARSFFYHLDRSTLQLTPAHFLIRKPLTDFHGTNRSQRAGENIALRKQPAPRFPYKLPVRTANVDSGCVYCSDRTSPGSEPFPGPMARRRAQHPAKVPRVQHHPAPPRTPPASQCSSQDTPGCAKEFNQSRI